MYEYTCTFINLSTCAESSVARGFMVFFSTLTSNNGVASNKVNTAFYNTAVLVQLLRPDVPFWQAHRFEKNLKLYDSCIVVGFGYP
jgi:hypothetical protein